MSTRTEGTRATAEPYREIVPAKGRWSRRLEPGQLLKIVDLEGQQAVDFLCYGADLPLDRINLPNTVKLNGSLYVTKGCKIYSDPAREMMTVIEDSCGYHDTLAGCCSCEIDKVRYNVVKTKAVGQISSPNFQNGRWLLRKSFQTLISLCAFTSTPKAQ
jgi:uncharacterized protein YcgI (DUF1989 family)